MRNSEFDTYDVKSKCERKLRMSFEGHKELKGWFFLDGKKHARLTVPKGRKFIPAGTYKSMAEQLRITVVEFDDLLLCPLEKEEYERIQREKLGHTGKQEEAVKSASEPVRRIRMKELKRNKQKKR
jgi:hypothetical protein